MVLVGLYGTEFPLRMAFYKGFPVLVVSHDTVKWWRRRELITYCNKLLNNNNFYLDAINTATDTAIMGLVVIQGIKPLGRECLLNVKNKKTSYISYKVKKESI